MADDTTSARQRLWERTTVDPITGCWVWTGQLDRWGYGKINVSRKTKQVHRFGYLIFGPHFNPELTLDHLCRNRACWNPAHLEPVPMRTNILRGVGPTSMNARKTHCPQGHEYSPDNIRRRADRPNERECLTCHRQRNAEGKKRRRQRAA